MNPKYLEKYFTHADGTYGAKPEIMSMITYAASDVFLADYKDQFDRIFCRSTVIYFNHEAKAMLYLKFYDMLADDWFLILGKTEILHGDATKKFKLFNTSERYYLKEGEP